MVVHVSAFLPSLWCPVNNNPFKSTLRKLHINENSAIPLKIHFTKHKGFNPIQKGDLYTKLVEEQ